MNPPEKLSFQPPHELNPKEKAFLAQMLPREAQLHALAAQMLGSSYFTGKTHGFNQWLKSSNPTQQTPAAK